MWTTELTRWPQATAYPLPAGRRGWRSCWAGSHTGSGGWSRDGPPARSCAGCWPTCLAGTAGRSLSTPARPPPTACSTGWPGRSGTTTGSATTSAPGWSSTSATPAAVLVVDETGDLKKGSHTVGGQRRYTGPAGKVDNAQVAVDLTSATLGRARGDRPRAVPAPGLDRRSRTPPGRRCPRPGGVRPKPELARVMLARALAARVPAGWGGPMRSPAQPGVARLVGGPPAAHVLAVKATEPRPSPRGPSPSAARLAEQLPSWCWWRLSAGQGPRAAAGRGGPPAARHRRAGRVGPLAAGAPQPAHRGAGRLPARRPGQPAAGRPGPGGGVSLAGRMTRE
jgi:DDE superfamily endonuclease